MSTDGAYLPGLMCSRSGCPNRWTVDFGKRLCSEHDRARYAPAAAAAKQVPLPGVAATPHWQDQTETDDEPLPF